MVLDEIFSKTLSKVCVHDLNEVEVEVRVRVGGRLPFPQANMCNFESKHLDRNKMNCQNDLWLKSPILDTTIFA